MKPLLLLNIFFHFILASLGQELHPVTSVTIIGTKHNGNKYITPKKLLHRLNEINPDIIYVEDDTVAFLDCIRTRVVGLELGSILQLWQPSIEQRAIQKYVLKNENCCLVPYDTVFARREYLIEYLYRTAAIYEALNEVYHRHGMTPADSAAYAGYLQLSKYFFAELEARTLEGLNAEDMIEISRLLVEMDNETQKRIIGKYIGDHSLVTWYNNNLLFAERRNNFMAKYLLKNLSKQRGKKVVVLTGLLHKYYLADAIKQYGAEYGVKLLE